jgi:DHA1 family putative efflux transporter-like MFS transporter
VESTSAATSVQAGAGLPRESSRRVVVVIAMLGSGTYLFSTLAMAPILVQVATQFDITIGTAGLATAIHAIPAVIVPIFVGPLSDRHGRERFIASGGFVLAVGSFVAALAPSFAVIVVGRAMAGVGAGLMGASLAATIADRFPLQERGRAFAWFSVASAVVNLAAVPISGIVAAATTWRVPLATVGVLGVMVGLAAATKLPRSITRSQSSVTVLYGLVLRNRVALLYLLVAFAAGLPMGGAWTTYVVAFFQTDFGLPQATASALALTGGIGVVVGGQAAGRLGDRLGHGRVLIVSILAGMVCVLAMTNLPLALAPVAGLNLLYTATSGARNVSQQSLVSEVVPEARATILSMNTSLLAASVVVGVALGGAIIDLAGFPGLGIFCAGMLLLAAILALMLERRATAP